MITKTALQYAREKRKLLQKDVAKELGIDYTYYSKIDRGERIPSLAKATAIAEFFHLDVRAILFPLQYMCEDRRRTS